jgi:REP element-mobilizing transposase RayT
MLDRQSRLAVLNAIRETCSHRDWLLIAAHVSTSHVHVIVESDIQPLRIMNALKSYASRALNRLGVDGAERRRWARHGSTRWLWRDQDVRDAIRYVVEEQGERMAVYVTEPLF